MQDSYELKLDYKKDNNSTHVFYTLLKIQKGFEEFNKTITSSFSNDIIVNLELIDIEKGSIKIKLHDIIKRLPSEEKITNFVDHPKEVIKGLIKESLIKTRQKLFEITTNDELSQIEKENSLYDGTKEILENSELAQLGVKVSKEKLLKAADYIYKPIRESKNDIYFKSNDGYKKVNSNFEVDLENTFKEDIKTITFRATLPIKKPVFLGNAKWELVYNKALEVEMQDNEFLSQIKNRKQPIFAGDMLDCQFKSVITYNDDYEIIEAKYYVLKVFKVISPEDAKLNI